MNQNDFVIRECDDCHDELEDKERRVRCKRCGWLVCRWCYHHVHSLPQPHTAEIRLRALDQARKLCREVHENNVKLGLDRRPTSE